MLSKDLNLELQQTVVRAKIALIDRSFWILNFTNSNRIDFVNTAIFLDASLQSDHVHLNPLLKFFKREQNSLHFFFVHNQTLKKPNSSNEIPERK